jgi:transposase
MLTTMQKHHIKYLNFHKGQSLRSIAKDTGHNFRTIRKYAQETDFNLPEKKKKGRPSKLEPVKPIIDTWLKEDLSRPVKQRHTAKRIYDRLCSEHGDIFNAKERTVRSYVSAKKKELYGEKEGYLPLEHPPGEAQADFGEIVMIEKGHKIKGYELILSFPYSNGCYPQVFKGQNQECLLTGLKDIFEHIKRVPKTIWFDNLSAAVAGIGEHGDRKLVDQFNRFALHYNFQPQFCTPGQGHEKGHVENKVGYSRRNFFVPEPEFDEIEEFNQGLFAVAEKDHHRMHYRKERQISELLKEDINAMLPLPEKTFDIGRLVKATADKYGKIKYDNNIYSIAPQVAKKELWVKSTAHRVEILDEQYRSLINHRRLYGHGREAMNWIPYLSTLAKRPNALKYTAFYRDLPDPWQEYLAAADYDEKKKGLNLLIRILTETDMDTATKCLFESMDAGPADAETILLSYRRLTEPEYHDFLPLISAGINSAVIYTPDLKCYDEFLKAGVGR